jgi:IclR family transcriptional regulator, pca regulon regulatory protein
MSTTGTPRTRSLDKAILLLRALVSGPRSASALARETGIPRATVARTLWTLADAGFVEETEDGWTLGYDLVRLGRAADPDAHLIRLARPYLAELRDLTGESALLAVPRGETAFEIVLQLDGPRLVGVTSWVGRTVPLYASAPGKLLLAELDERSLAVWLAETPLTPLARRTVTTPERLRAELATVRRDGIAELVDELEDGLAALASPVHDVDGRLVGMAGITGPTARLPSKRRAALRSDIRETALRIEQRLR